MPGVSGLNVCLGSGWPAGRSRSDEPAPVLAGRHPKGALEVPMEVALVGEAGRRGRRRQRLSFFEETPSGSNTARDLVGVRRQPGLASEQLDEAELPHLRDGREFVEPHVPIGPFDQVLTGHSERPPIPSTDVRLRGADGRRAIDQIAQPFEDPLVPLEPAHRCLERSVQPDEPPCETCIGNYRIGKSDAVEQIRLGIAGEIRQVGSLDDHDPGEPRPPIDRGALMRARGIPRHELTGQHQTAFRATSRGHGLPHHDPEDVLAARLDLVPGGRARHQQDPALARRTPHVNLLGHAAMLGARTFKTTGVIGPYARCMVITPHIVVQGADQAVTFYRAAFSAEEISRIPVPDGRLMSVELSIGDGLLHLADEFPELGVLAPPSVGGTAVVLALDVADAEAAFEKAIEAGATVRQRLQDTFWGDLHGQLEDPFGHRWNISEHLRDVPHEEVVAAAAALFPPPESADG
jgi:PhnB protein